ncbi:MAG: sulfurtransferase [Ilumatobacteraceae bacterium]
MIPPVVGAAVADELQAAKADMAIIDVRWYLDGRDGFAAFRDGHIPGARWADLDHQLSATGQPATEGRHPLPSPAAFAAAMVELGIGDQTTVLAYDDTGGIIAARLVVMLRMIGHSAALIDGGLHGWAGPIETGPGIQRPDRAAKFTPVAWPAERLADATTTETAAKTGRPVIDARSIERFLGDAVVPDKRPGHIPGARSAPASEVFTAAGFMRDPQDLRTHYAGRGITDSTTDAIAYCGSGVSACVNIVAMEHAGLAPARLYVASWSGWSADPTHPAATGEADPS